MIDFIALFVTLPIVILTFLFIAMYRSSEGTTDGEGAMTSHKLLWGVTVALALLYLMAGFPKLLGMEGVMQTFTDWGYSADFMLIIGLIEMVGAVLLLFPRTTTLAAVPLAIVMGGAIYTHIAAAEWAILILPVLALAGLAWVGKKRFSLLTSWIGSGQKRRTAEA